MKYQVGDRVLHDGEMFVIVDWIDPGCRPATGAYLSKRTYDEYSYIVVDGRDKRYWLPESKLFEEEGPKHKVGDLVKSNEVQGFIKEVVLAGHHPATAKFPNPASGYQGWSYVVSNAEGDWWLPEVAVTDRGIVGKSQPKHKVGDMVEAPVKGEVTVKEVVVAGQRPQSPTFRWMPQHEGWSYVVRDIDGYNFWYPESRLTKKSSGDAASLKAAAVAKIDEKHAEQLMEENKKLQGELLKEVNKVADSIREIHELKRIVQSREGEIVELREKLIRKPISKVEGEDDERLLEENSSLAQRLVITEETVRKVRDQRDAVVKQLQAAECEVKTLSGRIKEMSTSMGVLLHERDVATSPELEKIRGERDDLRAELATEHANLKEAIGNHQKQSSENRDLRVRFDRLSEENRWLKDTLMKKNQKCGHETEEGRRVGYDLEQVIGAVVKALYPLPSDKDSKPSTSRENDR